MKLSFAIRSMSMNAGARGCQGALKPDADVFPGEANDRHRSFEFGLYRVSIYNQFMIRSFRDTEAEKIFRQQFSKKLQSVEMIALRKLIQLNRAVALRDLAAIPGDQLEALRGDRKGQHSIRINDQYRICFRWLDGDAFDVEITDYH